MLRHALLLGLLIAALPSQAATPPDTTVPCADADTTPLFKASRCTTAHVPLRHEAPDAASIDLFIRRIPAVERRRGEVWLLAGGPGESGASLYELIPTFQRAFPGYDLVIPDHRGVGASARLCPVQEARDSEDGVALAPSEWGPCIGALYADRARTTAFSVSQAARDVSLLMTRHRGEGPVYLYGVSYGTQLALRTLQIAPVPLDGLILDGLVPPETDTQWDLSHRTALVDQVGRAVLGAENIPAYEAVIARAANAPWAKEVPGGNLRTFLGTLLNFPSLRARIPTLIDGLSGDDATLLTATVSDLKAVAAGLGQGGDARPSLPLVMLISASENNPRPGLTKAMVEDESKNALFVSPLPALLVDPPVPTYEKDAAFGKLPTSIPRTLVIHGTLDPNTAYEGAQAHVALLGSKGPVTFSRVEEGAHLLAYVAPSCFAAAASAFVQKRPVAETCKER